MLKKMKNGWVKKNLTQDYNPVVGNRPYYPLRQHTTHAATRIRDSYTMLIHPSFFRSGIIIESVLSMHLSMLSGITATPKQLPHLHHKFHAHIRCPYADRWLAKGPEQAAIELGLASDLVRQYDGSHRFILDRTTSGSCTYTNPFSGDSCTEFRGTGWTTDSMKERCSQEASSTFTEGEGCAYDDNTGGYCVKDVTDETFEYNLLVLSSTAGCDGIKMACETFVGGIFAASSSCGTADASPNSTVSSATAAAPIYDFSNTENDSAATLACGIAPGAIGAAHQAAFSSGYRCDSRPITYMYCPLFCFFSQSCSCISHNQTTGFNKNETQYKSTVRTAMSDSLIAIGLWLCQTPQSISQLADAMTTRTLFLFTTRLLATSTSRTQN